MARTKIDASLIYPQRGNDGTNAVPAGSIGETLTSVFSNVTVNTTNGAVMTSLALTAGVWLITGHMSFNSGISSNPFYVQMSVTTNSGNTHSGSTEGLSKTWGNLYAVGSVNAEANVLFPYRNNASSTMYLHADIGSGSYPAYGSITATRIA